jgi:hypothetical protein
MLEEETTLNLEKNLEQNMNKEIEIKGRPRKEVETDIKEWCEETLPKSLSEFIKELQEVYIEYPLATMEMYRDGWLTAEKTAPETDADYLSRIKWEDGRNVLIDKAFRLEREERYEQFQELKEEFGNE